MGTTAAAICFIAALPLFLLRGVGVYDDSVHLKFGEMVLYGARPYIDFIDNKPPGGYFLSALLLWLGGGSFWVVPRVFLIAVCVATTIITSLHVRRWFGDVAAAVVAPLSLLGYVTTQGYSLHTEVPASLFGLFGVITLANEQTFKRAVAAGMLFGLATLFKQTAAVFLIAAVIWSAFLPLVFRRRAMIAAALLSGYGIVGFGAVAAAWSAGVLEPMLEQTIGHVLLVMEHTPGRLTLTLKLLALVPGIVLLPIAFGLARGSSFGGQSRTVFRLWLITLVVSLLPTLRVDNSTGHYIALSAAAAAVVAATLVGRSRRRASIAVTGVLCAAYMSLLLVGGVRIWRDQRLPIDYGITRELRAALDNVAARDEPVYAFSLGGTPRLYLMSGRPPAVPYIHQGLNFTGRFDIHTAARFLTNGSSRIAVAEIPDREFTDFGLDAEVGSRFERVLALYDVRYKSPISPVSDKRTYLLVRKTGRDR